MRTMGSMVAGLLVLSACSGSESVLPRDHQEATTGHAGTGSTDNRALKYSAIDGKPMRLRVLSRQADGTKLLIASVPTNLIFNRAQNRLDFRRRTPVIRCQDVPHQDGVEIVGRCNSWMTANPADDEEFMEEIGVMYSEVAIAPTATPVSGLTSDSMLILSYDLPSGLTDYSDSSLVSLDYASDGNVLGGMVTGENGWQVAFTADGNTTPTMVFNVTGPDVDMEVIIGPDGDPVYLQDEDLLMLASGWAMADCGEEAVAAVGSTVLWGGAVYAAGSGGRAAYKAVGSGTGFVARISGTYVTAPARQSIGKTGWGLVTAVAGGVASAWETMHNAIQDLIACVTS